MLCLDLVELPMKMCKNSLWLIFKETPSKIIWLYKAQGLQLGDYPVEKCRSRFAELSCSWSVESP